MKLKSLVLAIATAAALSGGAYAADIVTAGDMNTVDKWYGRGGGLVGSDRVSGLSAGKSTVGVIYDQDVAARTNMHREPTQSQVGVTWDRDVAARTNMQRDTTSAPSATATAPAPTRN